MKGRSGLLVGVNILLLLAWAAYCSFRYPAGSPDASGYPTAMLWGIVGLVLLNLLGVALFGSSEEVDVDIRSVFFLSIVLLLLIGIGICGLAQG